LKKNPAQKAVIFAICVLLLIIIGILIFDSMGGSQVLLFSAPVVNPILQENIINVLGQEGINFSIDSNNYILIENEVLARRIRSLLIMENLIPPALEPWELFAQEPWSMLDFDKNQNLQRSLSLLAEAHILALPHVEMVSVTLRAPEGAAISANVIISPSQSSDVLNGIERILILAIRGLEVDNIIIQ